MTKSLTLRPVTLVQPADTPAERAARLLQEARDAMLEHVRAALDACELAERLASEVASGGETYHEGVKAAFRRHSTETKALRDTVETLMSRGTR